MTGHMGVSLAAINSHVDTGTSQNAKHFSFSEGGNLIEATPTSFKFSESGAKFTYRIFIKAPLNYDLYLERRYGIMAKTQDQLIPYMEKFEAEIFG